MFTYPPIFYVDNDFLDQDYVEFSEPAPQSLTLTEDGIRSPTDLQHPYGASNYHPTHNGGASNYPETNKTGDNTVISITPYTTPRDTEGRFIMITSQSV